jgi:hypothetical protein
MGLELVDDHHRYFSWYLSLDFFENFLLVGIYKNNN